MSDWTRKQMGDAYAKIMQRADRDEDPIDIAIHLQCELTELAWSVAPPKDVTEE